MLTDEDKFDVTEILRGNDTAKAVAKILEEMAQHQAVETDRMNNVSFEMKNEKCEIKQNCKK